MKLVIYLAEKKQLGKDTQKPSVVRLEMKLNI